MRHSVSGLLTFVLYELAAPGLSSSAIFDEITYIYIEDTSSSSGQLLTWNNTCERKKNGGAA
ncbi:hypothetical protein SAMN05421863_10812 [Nitrosomonas communis]|uniref:Uncharacterized protein n=1 Tax=Nitrosomonas communis TaxID=44574 RepID=A0A1I4VE14_9PROT|nr:hypothetical protein SAMN05421863_10812 [Nitrosomonas communis]